MIRIETPLGPMTLFASGGALVRVDLPAHAGAADRAPALPGAAGAAPAARDAAVEAEAARQLQAWFAGARRTFDVPLGATGTPFQRAVWAALRAIPFGETRSYGALARAVGRPGAARAVGAANAQNPIAILVPCHRVTGSDGTLTGYGGGLPAKRWLLAHEARFSAAASCAQESGR